MAFPAMNQEVANVTLLNVATGDTPGMFLVLGQYPMFRTQRPVDVSGMEMSVAIVQNAATAFSQSIASAATNLVLKPYDGGTTASAASGTNQLFANEDFSNSVTGGWTTHAAIAAVGTSTTDLDADDWVNLDVVANPTTTEGIGIAIVQAEFIYGVPGGPA